MDCKRFSHFSHRLPAVTSVIHNCSRDKWINSIRKFFVCFSRLVNRSHENEIVAHKWCHHRRHGISRVTIYRHLSIVSTSSHFQCGILSDLLRLSAHSAHALLLFGIWNILSYFTASEYNTILWMRHLNASYFLLEIFIFFNIISTTWTCGNGRECHSLNFTVRHLSTTTTYTHTHVHTYSGFQEFSSSFI